MKILWFSLKKTFKTPLYWIFILGILLLPPLFYQVGRQTSAPPSAYYLANPQDRDGALAAAYLQDAGFIPYESEASLRQDVEKGALEGGVLIPGDLSLQLAAGQFKGVLTFYISATALYPDLWQNHATAALFAVYAPYISASALEEEGISREEVLDKYQEMIQAGQLFHFELSTRDGILLPKKGRSQRFFLGVLALLLFLSTHFCVAAPLTEASRRIQLRIGRRKAFTSLYLPGMLLRGAGLFLAAGGACLAVGEGAWILPVLAALTAMLLFHWLLSLLPGYNWKDLLIIFITLFGLALTPMYLDLSLLIPATGWLRLLLPPSWLWLFTGML